MLTVGGGALAYAQVYGETTGTDTTSALSSTSVPGTPNTGAGGDAATNWVVLALAGVVIVAGVVYLARRREA